MLALRGMTGFRSSMSLLCCNFCPQGSAGLSLLSQCSTCFFSAGRGENVLQSRDEGFKFEELKANENAGGRNTKRTLRCTYCTGITGTLEQAQDGERLSAQGSKNTKERTGLG